MAELFGRKHGNPEKDDSAEPLHAAGSRQTVDGGAPADSSAPAGAPDRTRRSAGAANHEDYAADDGNEVDEEGDSEKLKPGFTFDWVAYRAKFSDMPLEHAVTSMFSEYAALYSRIAGQVGASVPPTLTLNEAADISAQA